MSELIVWYVQGDKYVELFRTKQDAERWARKLFPEEKAEKRYARIFYRQVQVTTMDRYQPVKPSTTGNRVKVCCSRCNAVVWEADAYADLRKAFAYVCTICVAKNQGENHERT